ncbi:hypothetical protein D3C71_647610 [compost metagenome]
MIHQNGEIEILEFGLQGFCSVLDFVNHINGIGVIGLHNLNPDGFLAVRTGNGFRLTHDINCGHVRQLNRRNGRRYSCALNPSSSRCAWSGSLASAGIASCRGSLTRRGLPSRALCSSSASSCALPSRALHSSSASSCALASGSGSSSAAWSYGDGYILQVFHRCYGTINDDSLLRFIHFEQAERYTNGRGLNDLFYRIFG